jgi:hypothetical protein
MHTWIIASNQRERKSGVSADVLLAVCEGGSSGTRYLREDAERLCEAGRQVKRGLLLDGASGTGKTLTAIHRETSRAGNSVLDRPPEAFRRRHRQRGGPLCRRFCRAL